MNAARTTAALAAAALGLVLAVPAQSSIESRQETLAQPRVWSAVAGLDTRAVIDQADSFAAGEMAAADAPYCDSAAMVGDTLAHDFGESLVDDSRVGTADTQLWGSDVMGTWTLVMARKDHSSCIVASGVGYSDATDPQVFYTKAGLIG